MPLYEYRCGECGKKFETLVWPSRPAAVACRHCGSPKVEKLVSRFATAGGRKSEDSDLGGDDFGGEGAGEDFESGGLGGDDDSSGDDW